MVNNLHIKPPEGDNPTRKEREIATDAPLHSLSRVKELSKNRELRTVTAKCDEDLIKLSWSIYDDVPELIQQLTEANYAKSQWCKTSSGRKGLWLACDVYKVTKAEYNPRAYRDDFYDYYLKFCINDTGKVLLIVSCHLQQY